MEENSLKFNTTPVFTRNYNAFNDKKIRFIINQGGARSSKTYSILQLIVWYCLTTRNRNVSIVRKTLTALKASAYIDVIEILHTLNIYDFVKENKSDNSIKFPNGTTIRFFSVDDSQKLRGRKHDVVYMNEANELTYEEFMQFNIRTHSKIIMDWNPSDPYSWIYGVEKEDNAIKIHSTYTDNPFLSPEIKREIENLINVNDIYYQIYTLGITPKLQEIVFPKYSLTPFPDTDGFVYGLDFGFNDPTALIKVFKRDNDLYLKQILYESYLTSEDIISKFKSLGVSQQHVIYADGSRPDQILTLNNAGFTVVKANKKISEGLDFMKTHNIHIDPESTELIKEFNVYSYKKYKDMILDVPIDLMNHGIDGARYGSMSFKNSFSTSFMVG